MLCSYYAQSAVVNFTSLEPPSPVPKYPKRKASKYIYVYVYGYSYLGMISYLYKCISYIWNTISLGCMCMGFIAILLSCEVVHDMVRDS